MYDVFDLGWVCQVVTPLPVEDDNYLYKLLGSGCQFET